MASAVSTVPSAPVHREAYALAVDARDARFDGVFFVGITTTRVYCRPVCPSRMAYDHHRRFFDSAAAAERAGFRPCLRCRPELAPGRTVVAALSRLAHAAAQRIAAGALNGRSVADLAHELGVSERHLRRALEREIGVSPLEQRVASVSRCGEESLRLTLAYRAPLAWDALLACLQCDATPGVEVVAGCRYGRTVRIGEHHGLVWAAPGGGRHVAVEVSASLLPALMPLIAGLRRLFDLDAEPAVVDAHLGQGGLGALVARRPGVRLPGALDGFEVALRALVGGGGPLGRVVASLGEPVATNVPGLTHLAPTAARVAEAGPTGSRRSACRRGAPGPLLRSLARSRAAHCDSNRGVTWRRAGARCSRSTASASATRRRS